jgi:Na+-transporting NADH:ubiquinone oxidoreductase subunit A
MVHVIKKGLDIPIAGKPRQEIEENFNIGSVGLVASDYHGLRPTMLVQPGDHVKVGQAILADKKNPGVIFTAPAAGVVESVNRGQKRRFLSIIINRENDNQVSLDDVKPVNNYAPDQLRDLLVRSGLWTAFRTRPYSKVPPIDSKPRSIFVTAIDTQPLCANPELVIAERRKEFLLGLEALTRLDAEKIFVCTGTDSKIPGSDNRDLTFAEFDGPHPAGLAGTHIHLLDPVGPNKTVWYINYQEVIAIGYLLANGSIMTDRVISLAGPVVNDPRLMRTQMGANLVDLTKGCTNESNVRIVSGSVLDGRTSAAPTDFLGRYHYQVSLLKEGNYREFLGWQKPGFDKFSVTGIYAGSWLSNKRFNMTTNLNGSKRKIVPVGTYERVLAMDTLPTHLLRALISKDTEEAQALGALELDEEDLALCTYVCPGKYDYGTILRDNLTLIEKEG